jgi:glycosyltransferase involved in cell wall biosynthesis
MNPKLSIITVNLNNLQGLKKTIVSVIKQSNNNFEFILIDGGSSDGSVELINNNKERLSYWISENDSGIYNAMNKGIRKAKGEYCLFLNSGDQLVHDNILKEVFDSCFNVDILYGNLQVVKNEQVIGMATTPAEITFKTLFEGTIHHQAAFIKRKLFEQFGFYNEGYKIRSDWEFWIRTIVFNNCTTQYLNKTISIYDADGISASEEAIEINKNETDEILSKVLPEKVLVDFKRFQKLQKEITILTWARQKKLLYFCIGFIYKIATKISRIRKNILCL